MNSLNGYKSANLIGTQDNEGQSNLAIFSSVIHMGSNPPLLGFITRPDTVSRHTLENIKETGIYTINHINTDIIEQAHQTSARYPKNVSEFKATGLNKQYINDFKAPFVIESLIGIGMRMKEIIPIPSNGTLLVVGEVQLVSYSDGCVLEDGKIDLVKAKTVAISGLDSYHSTDQIARLSYAKLDKELKRI
jgi:flavin reductase (DIM6/NTAB) family NADH-FMN oxidoreductase RutF